MIVDAYHPDANFVSSRRLIVHAAPERVWRALPDLPATLRQSRWAIVAGLPLRVASAMRGEGGLGSAPVSIDRVEEGREVVLVGHHRFADFATNIYVESLGDERTAIHNVTRAKFKTRGRGLLYLAGVHVFHNLYVDWGLRRLRALAES